MGHFEVRGRLGRVLCRVARETFKVMLHGTIGKHYFLCNAALQHCCDIDWNGCNIVPTLQGCAALKIVVANRPVQHNL